MEKKKILNFIILLVFLFSCIMANCVITMELYEYLEMKYYGEVLSFFTSLFYYLGSSIGMIGGTLYLAGIKIKIL